MVDESHTYDPPSGPAGRRTQVCARTDPVGPHVLGCYRVVVPPPVPFPSVPPPAAWPAGFPGDPG